MLNRFTTIVEKLTVFEENMRSNMDKTFGLIFSQRVLLSLIDKGYAREKAYDLVQPLAMQAWEEGTSFIDLVKENEEIQSLLSQEELDDCFDPTYHLKNVDMIFERLGLE